MADLFVTFAKARSRKALSAADAHFPVAGGAEVRTEALLITSSSQVTSLSADGEQFVRLRADAACFVQVGPDPTATALTSSSTTQGADVWPMASGATIDLEVRSGDKVAVIQA